MLGWEFPPVISGGLGVVTKELSNVLSDKLDLTLALPFTVQSDQDVNVVANLSSKATDQYSTHVDRVISKVKINKAFSPYPNQYAEKESLVEENFTGETIINENYDADIIENVKQYTLNALEQFRGKDYQVIYAHDWLTLMAGYELAKMLNVPFVAHVHSLSIDREGILSDSFSAQLEQKYLKLADVVVTVSKYTAHTCVRSYNVDFKKVKVVHNGLTYLEINPIKTVFKGKTVLFLGRVTQQKGALNFLKIAEIIASKNKSIRFVVAGRGDQLNEMIEKSASKVLSGKITFTGFVDHKELSKLFSVADVYCMPSESEPFGLSSVEASSLGLPCVISKQSGVKEVLKGAVAVDYWDYDGFANAISDLLTNKERRDSVVAMQNESLKKITWDTAGQKIAKILSEL